MISFISIAHAAENTVGQAAAHDLVGKINDAILFPIIALLMALAFLYFIYGSYEYVKNASNEAARETGRNHLMYGVIGMLVMLSAYAILNIAAGTFGLQDELKNAKEDTSVSTFVRPPRRPTGGAGVGATAPDVVVGDLPVVPTDVEDISMEYERSLYSSLLADMIAGGITPEAAAGIIDMIILTGKSKDQLRNDLQQLVDSGVITPEALEEVLVAKFDGGNNGVVGGSLVEDATITPESIADEKTLLGDFSRLNTRAEVEVLRDFLIEKGLSEDDFLILRPTNLSYVIELVDTSVDVSEIFPGADQVSGFKSLTVASGEFIFTGDDLVDSSGNSLSKFILNDDGSVARVTGELLDTNAYSIGQGTVTEIVYNDDGSVSKVVGDSVGNIQQLPGELSAITGISTMVDRDNGEINLYAERNSTLTGASVIGAATLGYSTEGTLLSASAPDGAYLDIESVNLPDNLLMPSGKISSVRYNENGTVQSVTGSNLTGPWGGEVYSLKFFDDGTYLVKDDPGSPWRRVWP